MKKVLALLMALSMMMSALGGIALAEDVEPGLLRTAVTYDISTTENLQIRRGCMNYV